MIYPQPGRYMVTVNALPEYKTAALTFPTGRIFTNLATLTVIKTQENVPGVAEWGQLENGNWIPTVMNSRARVKFVSGLSVTPPPPPPPTEPAPVTQPRHVIRVSPTGTISVDGLPYE